ncbi:LuxE/PaaK family acyltransferase [Brumimicrobium mesophilum]|uniref:LuxE/PaaK family acyltransferase n=1 Tax=Brumimicrobium mesophilum TaxID=392717 RepID=UPI001F365AE2|nr:acyl transferase [Brumimicrobium mesophilum]
MSIHNSLINSIFEINSDKDFNEVALKVYHYQYKHVSIYRNFCDALGRKTPTHFKEIPFLPISFFKTHKILSDEIDSASLQVFKSSGTTQSIRSQHYLADPKIYVDSFLNTFTKQIVNPKDAIIMALLPNYVEQGESSLVYMVDYLVKESNHYLSGFYLNDLDLLINAIENARKEDKKIILFGVSYALLDLAEKKIDLSGVIILETGGMKGRRKEMIKEELHEILCEGLKVQHIYSEYGMTELLSQAYTNGTEYFTAPKWMKVLIRDVDDPLNIRNEGKTGGVNVIDLANYYSCSFIGTDDLGIQEGNRFKILGRFDQSDIRGCNLLVN